MTVVDKLFRMKPFSTVKLYGLALSAAQRLGDVVWTELTAEMLAASHAQESEGEGIVNFIAGTEEARVAVLLYRHPDGYRVSMRAIADDVDVSRLAALYGGGGHARAAGCRLPPGEAARDPFLRDIAERVSPHPTRVQSLER